MAIAERLEGEFLSAYDQYADAVFRHCFYKTSNRELAKDLAQQTFLKVWSYLKGGGSVQNFRAFLYQTANNLVIDWYRRSKSDSLDQLMEGGYEPSNRESDPTRRAEMSWALETLKQLDPDDQQLVTWRYVEDVSLGEMANMLGEKENNVSVRLHRAMARLKELLLDKNAHGSEV